MSKPIISIKLPASITLSNDCYSTAASRRRDLKFDRSENMHRVNDVRRSLRVLIIADLQSEVAGLANSIRNWGYVVCQVLDSPAALLRDAEQTPDVLLLDLEAPLFDGCQFAKQFRTGTAHEDCFVIAVTDAASDERRLQCAEAGIDLLLHKPVAPSLVETLLMLECIHINISQGTNVLSGEAWSETKSLANTAID